MSSQISAIPPQYPVNVKFFDESQNAYVEKTSTLEEFIQAALKMVVEHNYLSFTICAAGAKYQFKSLDKQFFSTSDTTLIPTIKSVAKTHGFKLVENGYGAGVTLDFDVRKKA